MEWTTTLYMQEQKRKLIIINENHQSAIEVIAHVVIRGPISTV
jgi:hypothetical protein